MNEELEDPLTLSTVSNISCFNDTPVEEFINKNNLDKVVADVTRAATVESTPASSTQTTAGRSGREPIRMPAKLRYKHFRHEEEINAENQKRPRLGSESEDLTSSTDSSTDSRRGGSSSSDEVVTASSQCGVDGTSMNKDSSLRSKTTHPLIPPILSKPPVAAVHVPSPIVQVQLPPQMTTVLNPEKRTSKTPPLIAEPSKLEAPSPNPEPSSSTVPTESSENPNEADHSSREGSAEARKRRQYNLLPGEVKETQIYIDYRKRNAEAVARCRERKKREEVQKEEELERYRRTDKEQKHEIERLNMKVQMLEQQVKIYQDQLAISNGLVNRPRVVLPVSFKKGGT